MFYSVLNYKQLGLGVYSRVVQGNPEKLFNGTRCNIKMKPVDFFSHMSVLYMKGHFILGADFNGSSVFDLYPNIGTESGECKTIKPMVSNQMLLILITFVTTDYRLTFWFN